MIQTTQRILAIMLMAATLFGRVDAGLDRCGLCRKSTTYGAFVTVGDHIFHKRCYGRAKTCSHCKLPGSDHKSCGPSKACGHCGQAIRGPYLVTSGRHFHETCYETAPKCGICNTPEGGAQVRLDQKRFHKACYQKAMRCGVCPQPLIGVYYLDHYNRKSCGRHRETPKCSSCAWPGVAWSLRDGRTLCNRCNDVAVFDPQRAVDLVVEVKAELAKMGLVIERTVNLELVGEVEMAKRRGPAHATSLGKFSYHRDADAVRSGAPGTLTISILYGLPEPLFRGVAAHELGHAWQSGHCVKDQNEQVVEGTAELISYLYVSEHVSEREAQRIRTKTIEPYATGFRKAGEHYKKRGGSFFTWVRTVRSF